MINLTGSRVTVEHGNVEKALRLFKKKVEKSGILKELRAREYYEKPTTTRKREKAAAKARQLKQLKKQQLPPKRNSK